ncbi:Phosphatidylinositol 4-kinase [Podosphaera aphanis]|nr:Phosphatidylinositol 4-kinase [Podosphaera aphanis]
MLRDRPAATGYARIAQAEDSESDEDLENGQAFVPSASRFTSTAPGDHPAMCADENISPHTFKPQHVEERTRSNSSGVDIKAINARLEKWADEIASKFKSNKVKGTKIGQEKFEIHHSVFQAPENIRPATAEMLASKDDQRRMSKHEFDEIVESVKIAIEQGMHPKMISQGSSGSYFARNSNGDIVGVFKPKDEEPYAAGNPKWNKWIHRNLFPCFFGRACLIPNLSYVSEAAAYTLDCRLRTHLVPYTGIVHLSSKSFHYDFWHRRNYYRRKKPFPAKVGSFQVFLKGYKDANVFLRENSWPDHSGGYRLSDTPRKKKKSWTETCRASSSSSESEDTPLTDQDHNPRFVWTETLQQSFREELEKLVILDYIMRNTDRGLDNWMIKVDYKTQDVSIISEPIEMRLDQADEPNVRFASDSVSEQAPYRTQNSMSVISQPAVNKKSKGPRISIGAIDNSLSWPWKHPDAWRSFPFGWLFLPVSLIGKPFSQKTRDHFLPLLTSKQWWIETQLELKSVFSQDVDFKERMFARQIAVMKGQAWNVVETLKLNDHGPLELTRRARVCVWDDLVDIPVAIPMRLSSVEIRRRHDQELQEEMDISIVSSSGVQPDLLGLTTPTMELPNANRFELLGSHVAGETSIIQSAPAFSTLPNMSISREGKGGLAKYSQRSAFKLSRDRMSYDGPSRPQIDNSHIERRFSFNLKAKEIVLPLDGDDLESDLGYAAAEEMEGNHRKVIVERLETVKSKYPVFTWC